MITSHLCFLQEFYLKCAAHPTCDNDTSAALDLIMPNTRRVPCIACTDASPCLPGLWCWSFSVNCLECFHLYCVTRLNERQTPHQSLTRCISLYLPLSCLCTQSFVLLQFFSFRFLFH
uniref:RING/Ubox-like zinc-binding domain-containing protein n=1 Tax=Cyprinus carpio TaxID=7962 RepID=A0A8C1GEC9_CYPCA